MNNNHKSKKQQAKRRKSREVFQKQKKEEGMKRSKEISKIIGCKRTRADYGDKLYDKSMEAGNTLRFTPKKDL